MTDHTTGIARGAADRLGWCDIKPGPKADGAREMWRRARRAKLRLEMAFRVGPETLIATVVACRRLPGGRVRLRFEADPMTVAVTSGTVTP